jgi:hypothetical protein
MARNYRQGEYVLKNPEKYVGKLPVIYRSSWEFALMRVLDNHPAVTQWASESIQIPYKNPFTNRWTVYIPDFFIVYVDKNGKHHAELVEVKPEKETPEYGKRVSQKTKAIQQLNLVKWTAARVFCSKNGIRFRVATEKDLFGRTSRK